MNNFSRHLIEFLYIYIAIFTRISSPPNKCITPTAPCPLCPSHLATFLYTALATVLQRAGEKNPYTLGNVAL